MKFSELFHRSMETIRKPVDMIAERLRTGLPEFAKFFHPDNLVEMHGKRDGLHELMALVNEGHKESF